MSAKSSIQEKAERLYQQIGTQEFLLSEKKRLLNYHQSMLVEIEEAGFKVYLSAEHQCHVVISDIAELTVARRILRKGFGTWNDSFQHTWYSCGVALASWKGENAPMDIWLETSIESFPAELLPTEGCKWEKVQEDSFRVVCPIDGGE